MPPALSTITVNLNDAAGLSRTLASIGAQTFADRADHELVPRAIGVHFLRNVFRPLARRLRAQTRALRGEPDSPV